jgi:phosphatidylinositol alpha-1,6-mannosyltransferase
VADALLVSSSFLPGAGGIESYLGELSARLDPRLAVLAPRNRDGTAIPRGLGYSVHGRPRSMVLPTTRLAGDIARTATEESTDRVLFGTPWPLGLLGPRLRALGLRYALIVHGAEMVTPAFVPGLRGLMNRALNEADLLLPVSEFTASRLKELFDPQTPMTVLRARVDEERFGPGNGREEFRSRLGLGPADRVVLCFGRLVRRKGIHRLLELLPDISTRVPEAVVVIAGAGPQERALRRLALGAGPVRFAGRIPEGDAPALYRASDLFVLPVADRWGGLDTEGLGVALLEAAASGLPCVTGRSGGTPEAVIHERTGFVVDARNRAELTRAIIGLLIDPERGRLMGQRGRAHVVEHFSRAPLPRSLVDWLSRGS